MQGPARASLKSTNLIILPIVYLKLWTPIDMADTSIRFATVMDQLPKDGFLVRERLYGGVSFGTIRYGLTQWEGRTSTWGSEPHDPATHDGQVLLRGKVTELASGGSRLWVVLFPATFANVLLLFAFGGFGYPALVSGDWWLLIFPAFVWTIIQLRVQFLARRLKRLLHHAYGAR